jgi:hypothetical protein
VRNPWQDLPRKPLYVLEVDRPHVEAFNRRVGPRYQLDLRLMPVPFMGNRTAPLLVLGLNPSFQPDSLRLERGRPRLAKALRDNLGSDRRARVHISLTSEFEDTGGGRWWRDCLRALIDGRDPNELAPKVLAVDFHGYRSKGWQAIPFTLPSQLYGFHLVESAIDRGATIVVTRGARHWEVAVPRLYDYRFLVRTNTARIARISPGNCGEEGFAAVRKALTVPE